MLQPATLNLHPAGGCKRACTHPCLSGCRLAGSPGHGSPAQRSRQSHLPCWCHKWRHRPPPQPLCLDTAAKSALRWLCTSSRGLPRAEHKQAALPCPSAERHKISRMLAGAVQTPATGHPRSVVALVASCNLGKQDPSSIRQTLTVNAKAVLSCTLQQAPVRWTAPAAALESQVYISSKHTCGGRDVELRAVGQPQLALQGEVRR